MTPAAYARCICFLHSLFVAVCTQGDSIVIFFNDVMMVAVFADFLSSSITNYVCIYIYIRLQEGLLLGHVHIETKNTISDANINSQSECLVYGKHMIYYQ